MQKSKRKHIDGDDKENEQAIVLNSNISDHPDPIFVGKEEETKESTTKTRKKKQKENLIPDNVPSVEFYRDQWCNLLRAFWGDQAIVRLFKFPNVNETCVGDLEETGYANGFEFITFQIANYIFTKLFDCEEIVIVKEITNNEQLEIKLTSLTG